MKDDLIFDLGMNNGDDTDFYLKKGYKVVAVEPNGQLCALAEQRFAAHIAQGRLTVVHKAVAASPGEISFFLNDDVSGWSTTSANWQQTRVGAQTQTRKVTVAAVTIQELLGQHGTPYYIKTDIQGAELAALEGLLSGGERPNYISVSAGSDVLARGAYAHVRKQLERLDRLGYRRFNIVAQQDTRLQTCPDPPREGRYVQHEFPHGSSGLFGRELPGEWVNLAAALREHWKIALSYSLAGHSRSPAGRFPKLPSERLKHGLDRVFWRGLGWYDTHAAF